MSILNTRTWVDTKVPESSCCECGNRLDGATGSDATPSHGDFMLCIVCGSLNVFADDMTLRQPTVDEYVASTHINELQQLRKAIAINSARHPCSSKPAT